MIEVSERKLAAELINEACNNGARLGKACEILGISERTYQRWTKGGDLKVDGRPDVKHSEPTNKLTKQERSKILDISHSPEFASSPPCQIVPRLADQGIYIASESSFYRVLRDSDEQHHRGRSQSPRPRRLPPSHCAGSPNQLWSWDITWLPGPVKGLFFYLYLIIDIYSRKVVGWEIFDQELAEYASTVVEKAVLAEKCINNPLILHSDNGSPMKGSAMIDTLYRLGLIPSYSRPRVSNDNPFSESIFRTFKYRPDYPDKGFVDIETARQWVYQFIQWYNFEHRHSSIKYVTPNQRHCGEDKEILCQRHQLYQKAKKLHPERWARDTRNWEPVDEVWLNPNGQQHQ